MVIANREGTPLVPGWQVQRCLGRGRSGDVFLARDDTGRWAAMRRLEDRPQLLHPGGAHLVGVHDVLEADDGWCAVLDLVEGGTLHRHLEARGRATLGETLTVLVPLAATLRDLHRRDLAHGVVDARHVLLSRVGRPVLTDLAGACAHPTRSDDPAADVLGLGGIGWRALAGADPAHPWERAPLARELGVTPHGSPVALRTVVEVVQACVDPDPHSRPRADEVVGRLRGLAEPEPLFPASSDEPSEQVTRRIPERFLRHRR